MDPQFEELASRLTKDISFKVDEAVSAAEERLDLRFSRRLDEAKNELTQHARSNLEELTQQARANLEELKQQARANVEELKQQARSNVEELKQQARSNVEELKQEARSNVEELTQQARFEREALKQQAQSNLEELKHQAQLNQEELKERITMAAEGYAGTLESIRRALDELNSKVDTKFADHGSVLANHHQRITALERRSST